MMVLMRFARTETAMCSVDKNARNVCVRETLPVVMHFVTFSPCFDVELA